MRIKWGSRKNRFGKVRKMQVWRKWIGEKLEENGMTFEERRCGKREWEGWKKVVEIKLGQSVKESGRNLEKIDLKSGRNK